MGFAGVYRAVYGYSSASEQELSLKENDLLYLIEAAEDGWWTVKKRVPGAASEEPEGIVPHNYIEPAKPEEGIVRALYSYEKQTSEEVSFSEGSQFHVYATDGDWVLVGTMDSKEFGFVPNNYIEKVSSSANGGADPTPSSQPANLARAPSSLSPHPESSHSPAYETAPPKAARPQAHEHIHTEADAPPRPARPGQQRPTREVMDRDLPREPSAESKHLKYPITDISGRRRIAKTLVIAPNFVTLINDDGGGKTQKWDVHDIRSYSSEKKHIFLDLENPTASLELKASSQSEADRIVSSLGQIVGAGRGGGLQEVLAAAKTAGHKQGQIVLDFRAANTRELSVREYETVYIINDTDKDWWLVRNVSGKEGIVPRKFVHLDKKDGKLSDFFRNSKQKNRSRDKDIEREHNTARQAARELHREKSSSGNSSRRLSRQRSTHHDRSLPDNRKMRLWIDRSGSFKVDAQLLGCSEGKVHLHKANGVKIAVPANKLSTIDIDYVESVTGVSLSEDVPLSERSSRVTPRASKSTRDEPSAEEANSRNDYWLSFFLGCGVDPQNSNRYAKNFTRDNMDSSSLKDVNSSVLRTLGLREGDILRVTKKINEDLGRVQKPEGGLYSNDGGALQNNTGTTSAAVENQVWADSSKGTSPTPAQAPQQAPQQAPAQMLSQPSLQPQPTAGLTASQNAPQQALSSAPTGALADLLGVNATLPTGQLSATITGAAPQQVPNLTAATTGFNANALKAQNTAEAKLAAQQRETQHQILRQQAQLQAEQIKLLREQQEQLRRQQSDLVQIQKTGSQLTALGPFATGVAGLHMQNPTSAASVLAAPPPPQPRAFHPVIQQPFQTGMTQPNLTGLTTQPFTGQPTPGLGTHSTGPFIQQRTGPMVQPQVTGPFAQSHTTGQFIPNQPTGPFSGANFGQTAPQVQPQVTGPFKTVPSTPTGAQPMSTQLTGPFANMQRPPNVGPQSVPFTSFGSVQPTPSQANLTNTLANFNLTGQRTGPLSLTGAGTGTVSQMPQAQQMPLSNPLLQNKTPFGQPQVTQNPTLFSQATGPFRASAMQQMPATTFGNQFQIPQQAPQQALQQAPQPALQQQTGPFGSFGSMQPFPSSNPTGSQFNHIMQNQVPSAMPFQPNQAQFVPQSQPTGQFAQGYQGQQATGPFQSQQQNYPVTSFGQAAPQQSNQIPLQSQATGFGFGNQPQAQSQSRLQQRANLSMASANNPFGL